MSLRVERNGPIFEMTIDRPKANAIDAATSRQMGELFTEFRDNPQFRVAILTGSDERFFCAGWDLKAAAEGEEYETDYGTGGFGGFVELPDLTKPVIAAVNGAAVGGGFELVMAAHLAVAVDHATFFTPEASVGVIPDVGSVLLPRLLPPAIANEVLMTGRRLTADEALQYGLVNRVVPGGELINAARELADAIVSAAPLAIAAIIETGQATASASLVDALGMLRDGAVPAYTAMLESEDAVEGPQAFAEKREPQWKEQ